MALSTDLFPDRFVVAGIDTDAGKTLVSALLCLGLEADYWKPVQAGTDPDTDTGRVQSLTGLPAEHFHPEAYRLQWPASPHAAAAREGIRIEEARLFPPESDRRMVIEGAGGLMVPLRDDLLYIDLMQAWRLPVLLVVRTYLGSINHSLLSLEAMRQRGIPLLGIVFNDGGRPESEGVIAEVAEAPVLGRVPKLDRVDRETLLGVWESW